MNFVEEVQVLTSRCSSAGGVFNVITKSGSNVFHSNLFNYYRNNDWTPENVERRRDGARHVCEPDDQLRLRRLARRPHRAGQGVVLRCDRPHQGDDVSRWRVGSRHVGQYVNRQYDRDANIYAAKATFTPATNHTVMFSAFGDPTEREGWLTNPMPMKRPHFASRNPAATTSTSSPTGF